MRRRVVATTLVLSAWVAGSVAGSIGGAPAVGARPFLSIGRAHASFVPDLEGSDPIFILLIGSDARPGTETDEGLADSLHVLGINPEQRRATLFGIPRDSYVPIASGGSNKINSAMSGGGIENQIATVENYTGIEMDYWAITRFEGFSRAATQVGGITVDVPVAFTGYAGTQYSVGEMELRGNEALEFARTRKSLSRGDFQRSLNQGVVVQGAVETFRQAFGDDPTELYRWMGAGLRNIQTSLSIPELTDLAMLAISVKPARLTNLVAVGGIGNVNGMSVVNLSSANTALWSDLGRDGFILEKDIPADASS